MKFKIDDLKCPPDDSQWGSGEIKFEIQQAESSLRHLKHQIGRAALEFGVIKSRAAGIKSRLDELANPNALGVSADDLLRMRRVVVDGRGLGFAGEAQGGCAIGGQL